MKELNLTNPDGGELDFEIDNDGDLLVTITWRGADGLEEAYSTIWVEKKQADELRAWLKNASR